MVHWMRRRFPPPHPLWARLKIPFGPLRSRAALTRKEAGARPHSPFDRHDLAALHRHRAALTPAPVPVIAISRSGTDNLTIKPVSRPKNTSGFVILPRRWVVERSLAWMMHARRHARDYERLIQHSETLITWAAITLMTRRLA